MPLDISTFNNRVTQCGGPLAADALFQFVDIQDLGMMDSPNLC